MKRLGPFLAWTDHDLNGYGGTWHREYIVTLRLGPWFVSFNVLVARNREKSRREVAERMDVLLGEEAG